MELSNIVNRLLKLAFLRANHGENQRTNFDQESQGQKIEDFFSKKLADMPKPIRPVPSGMHSCGDLALSASLVKPSQKNSTSLGR